MLSGGRRFLLKWRFRSRLERLSVMPTLESSRKFAAGSPIFTVVGLLALCLAFFFWRLDAYTLFDRTETETAEVARQMFASGDWVTPIFNGIRYFDKPVLLYWLMAIGFQFFGVGEWGVRLPSALFATVLVLITYGFTRRLLGARPALLATTILIANPFVFGLARTGVTDMGLGCFMAAALYGWYWSFSEKRPWGYWLGFACLAGAVLIKGPIGLLLPGLTILIFAAWSGQWRRLAELPWLGGTALFALLTLPWYVLVTQANGAGFLWTFFFHHNIDRFLSVIDNQPGPWYYYLLYTPAGFFPWVALLPVTLPQLARFEWVRRSYWQQRPPAEQLRLFLCLWFAIVLVFLSTASTKLPHYIMPALPALALLCAIVWESQMRQAKGPLLRLGLAGIAGFWLLLAVAFAVAPRLISDPTLPDLRASLEATGLPWMLAGICLAAAIAAVAALVRAQLEWAWAGNLLAFFLLFIALINGLMPLLEPQLHGPLLAIANRLHREVRPGILPASLNVYAPSLNFYGRIDRIPVYIKSPQVRYQMAQSERMLLVTTAQALCDHWMLLNEYPIIYSAGIYRIYDIPPHSRLRYSKSEACQQMHTLDVQNFRVH